MSMYQHHADYRNHTAPGGNTAAAPGIAPAARFAAFVAAEPVAWGDSLQAILADLEAVHERGDDVALWCGPRLLAVLTAEGRLVWLRAIRPE